MTFQDVLNKMTQDAKKHNISLAELCAKNLHNKKSPVKLYLTKLGKQPAAGTIPLAMQAGECIYNELGNDKNKLMALLAVNPQNIPNTYKNFAFYDLMKTSPSAFLSVLAIYEESPAVSKFDGKNAVISSAINGMAKVSYADSTNAFDVFISAAATSSCIETRATLQPMAPTGGPKKPKQPHQPLPQPRRKFRHGTPSRPRVARATARG